LFSANLQEEPPAPKRFLRPRKGIKIFPLKDLFRKLHLRTSQEKILRVCLTSFSPKFTSEKDFFFPSEKKQKSYIFEKNLHLFRLLGGIYASF
jgi:hypothetical protein